LPFKEWLKYSFGGSDSICPEARQLIKYLVADGRVAKFAEGYEDKVFAIFDKITSQLSKKEKKYKPC